MDHILTAIIVACLIIVLPILAIIIIDMNKYIGAVYILILTIIGAIYAVRHT